MSTTTNGPQHARASFSKTRGTAFSSSAARATAHALELVESLAPDVLILDLHRPILDGIATIRRLRAQGSNVAAVLTTASDEPGEIAAAFEAGVNGYVAKGAILDRLIREILLAVAT